MNKCLFTKLAAVVDNDNLPYFDAIKLNCSPCTNGLIQFQLTQGEIVIKVLSGTVTHRGSSFTEKTFNNVNSLDTIMLDPDGCVILIKNIVNIKRFSTPARNKEYSSIDGWNTSDFEAFYNLVNISLENPKSLNGTIMDFVGRNMERLQFNGIGSYVTGEIKDFVKAECLSGRTEGSTFLQCYPIVTFDGKAGTGNRGDVIGTVTYNESGAVVVLTKGTAVEGTYNYDKNADTWTTESTE